MISIIVLALWLKTRQKKLKRCVVECCTDSTRDVVFCFFLKRAQTGMMVPSTPPAGRRE